MRASVRVMGIVAAVAMLTGCAPGVTRVDESPSPGDHVLTVTSGDPVGTWGTVAERETYLIVNGDGTFGGHDGCNGFGGRWESDEAAGTIEFIDAAMTLVMCEGMDTWLTRGRHAAPAGDRMQILDDEYRIIGTLPRTAG